jgi:glycosyltransferase involved in cell wall biosynthesis
MIVLLPLVRAIPQDRFYQDIASGIQEALLELGHTVQWFPLAQVGMLSAAEAEAAVRWAHAGAQKLVIDLCCWGHAISQARLVGEDIRPVYDVGGVSCVALFLDQAFFQPIASIHAQRLYAAVPDPNLLEQIALTEPGVRLAGSMFVPPAVRAKNDLSVAWERRDIDVLYVGNLHHGALERSWSGHANAALHDALADAASADLPLHLTALEVARALGRTPDAEQWRTLLRNVEYFLRAKSRLAAVLAAARSGARMHVVGGGWDKVALPDNVSIAEQETYPGMLALAGRSRICLDASSYPGGANDRVFNYALNGAACLTNSRQWLSQCFGRDEGMHFYQSTDTRALPAQIRELLAQPAQLQRQGEAARAITLAAHTWRHRVETILAGVASG